MKRIPYYSLVLLALLAIGCSSSRQAWTPQKKYPKEKLEKDYRLFRNILEESHPSLYWFTPKDSMDYFFDQGFNQLQDSMSEPEFRNILSYVINKVHCGHTSIKNSKKYSRYLDTARSKLFPLSFKVWEDTMVVIGNLIRENRELARGTPVTKINGYPTRFLVDTFLNYLPGDGYSGTGKYQMMSNRGAFGILYRNLFGLTNQYTVNYIDSSGTEKETVIPVFEPKTDTSKRDTSILRQRPPRDQTRFRVLNGARNVQIDTTLSSAYMVINTFSRGNRMRSFFRKTFRVLNRHNIKHLVIDVRSNGGGDAGISTALTRYLVDKKFKLADSLYAIRRSSKYGKYMKLQPMYWTFMQFVTSRKKDGKYHFGFFERHYFRPKNKNHFDNNVYLITGGNSFSATTLFVKALQGQSNVVVIGEETGGGGYGNSAWMIPDVTLPNTKVRFRLPKFRLVMDSSLVKEGRGVMPDIEIGATIQTVRLGIDPKIAVVRKLIERRNAMAQQ